jgi:hypothetical protein
MFIYVHQTTPTYILILPYFKIPLFSTTHHKKEKRKKEKGVVDVWSVELSFDSPKIKIKIKINYS